MVQWFMKLAFMGVLKKALPTAAVLEFPSTTAVAGLVAITSLLTPTRLRVRSRCKVRISPNFALMAA
jgi:hypothetical protein